MPTLLEEAASSFSSTSKFDVVRSMFDVQIPLTPHPRPVLVAEAFFPLGHFRFEGGFR
jgi:hypothetical protein